MSRDTSPTKNTGPTKKRRARSRTLASLVSPLTRAAFADRGFHHVAILTEWRSIVGPDLADRCAAISLDRDGTLTVRADGSAALEIQHIEPQIRERIATYFGFHAVKRLVLRQGPVPEVEPPVRELEEPSEPLDQPVEAALAEVPDSDLREALARLAARVSGTTGNDTS